MSTEGIRVRLPQRTIEALDGVADALGASGKTEAVRHLIRQRAIETLAVEGGDDIAVWLADEAKAIAAVPTDGASDSVLNMRLSRRLLDLVALLAEPGEALSTAIRRIILTPAES